jgi:hypothetical protein
VFFISYGADHLGDLHAVLCPSILVMYLGRGFQFVDLTRVNHDGDSTGAHFAIYFFRALR